MLGGYINEKDVKSFSSGSYCSNVMVVVSIFAQDICSDFEANQALYAKYTENYNGPITEATLAKEKWLLPPQKNM